MTRLIARGINAIVLVVLFAASLLWVWSGHDSSMGYVLQKLPSWLEQARGLQSTSVKASLREGGTIGELSWQADGLSIRAVDIQIRYNLGTLLERRLDGISVTIGQLHIADQSAKAKKPTAPEALQLPLPIGLSAQVGELFWQKNKNAVVKKLAFDYAYDHDTHQLKSGQAQIASGTYNFQAQLGAEKPLRVQAQITGRVAASLAGIDRQQRLAAQASIQGELGSAESLLAVEVDIQPEQASRSSDKSGVNALGKARVSAQLAPWRQQPIVKVTASWSALDLSLLWPQAPSTSLTGEAQVRPIQPSGFEHWDARLELVNQQVGPVNQNGLPLARLSTEFSYQGSGWLVKGLRADLAGGTVAATGKYVAGQWQIDSQVQGVEPQQLDSRLSGGAVSGQVRAKQGAASLDFEADLRADRPVTPPAQSLWPIAIVSIQADGSWRDAVLRLRQVMVQTKDARLAGSMLQYDSRTHATAGQAEVQIPGLKATVSGQAAPDQGQGKVEVRVSDAQRSATWLAQIPTVHAVFAQGKPVGAMDLDATWRGGWARWKTDLQVDLAARASGMQWATAASGPGKLLPVFRDMQIQARGTLREFNAQSSGQALLGEQEFTWSVSTDTQNQDDTLWRAKLQQAKFSWRQSRKVEPWRLDLAAAERSGAQPLTVDWRPNSALGSWHLLPATASLKGPLAGEIKLLIDETVVSTKSGSAPTWRSSGRVPNLPTSWLEAGSPKTLRELGLESDLALQARWEAEQSQYLHLQATVERSAGDLRLLTDDPKLPVVPAKLRDLRLQLDFNDQQLAGSLRWESESAGRVLVAASTRLEPSDGSWQWRDDAPLAAGIQLQSPPAQAWSAFAPPGWRLQGIVDADITLSGTRAVPIWRGNLRARDLAIRSLVHGLDFEKGRLSGRLDGQTLTIEDGEILGSGTGGGRVQLNGKLDWLSDSKISAVSSHVRMKLDANLQALRVSVRPDRRVTASGQLKAGFDGQELSLNGALMADHALITLPNESAPSLGEDVVVLRPAGTSAASLAAPASLAADSGSPKLPFFLKIALDPGPDFQIRGRGLQGKLKGNLALQSRGPGTTQLSGTLSTVDGVYQAFGQRLNIEKGNLLFSGAIDNPALDILAIRPQLSQKVGVQIGGNALLPVVRLYSDPDLPDAQKLSWLLLGRASGGGGAEAALIQQATMAMITGRNKSSPTTALAQAFGLDDLSLQGKSSTSGGEIDGASLTLGKRLSKDVYVAYEHSLAGTLNAFSIFYDLTSRLTLRGQAGEKSAIDLIYTLRYD